MALADVTGVIEVQPPIAISSENFVSAGGGTIQLGVTGRTTLFGDSITATDLTSGSIWSIYDDGAATGGAYRGHATNANTGQTFVVSANIIITVAVGDVSDGQLDCYFLWRPLSSNGNLVLATGMTAI